jgi:hypothetical protein
MHRFFVYEEYGAKYESLVRDIASTHRTLPQWDAYQKGLEALAASLMSVNNRMENRHKSITVGDLLVKVRQACDSSQQCSHLVNSPLADPTSLQIPSDVCRASQADTSLRLPGLTHAD